MTSHRPLGPETFREPSRDFGILPFWFLNGELDPDEMRFQLGELRDKQMQGVILHGRYGLEMPYVGETYLERIALAAEEGTSRGLTTWIYDEMNWPSGTADKRVLRARPDLAQRYIECVTFTIQGPWFMCLTGEDSRYLDFERSTPVAAFAIGQEGEVIDLTSNLSFGRVVPWEVPPGTWRLCYIVEKRADYYIDALDPESTEEFIAQGYEPYARSIDPISSRITGFYSDEPAMFYFMSAQDLPVVPWTKHMFRRFRERNGYDLRPRLPDLFFDVRSDSAEVRHDFYTTLTAFYSDAYYRQLHAWCREHGVRFVAHLLYEEWLRGMVRVEGNLFSHYRHMDVVGVDHLYPVIGTRAAPEQHVALKVASSAAHHFGADQVICESFGGIFMDATMQRMKWIADWEYVLGVNVLNPHGFHYTLEGARKRDWPPSMFYQYPWWRHYDRFSAYMSRLSETLTGGSHVAKVAVLWPINAMFAEYRPQERTEGSEVIEGGLNAITDTLLRLHHDFDYLDEDVLAESRIERGRVHVADEAYELVIVPPMSHVRETTLDALEGLLEDGGKVVSVLGAPSRSLGRDGLRDVEKRVDTMLAREGAIRIDGDALDLIRTAREGDRRFIDALRSAMDRSIVADLRIDDEELFALHRRKDDRDLFFVINPTFEERRARVSIRGEVPPELWDPSTGEIRSAGPVLVEHGTTSFDLVLPAVGSTFLVSGVGASPSIVGSNVMIERVDGDRAVALGSEGDGWIDVRRNGHVARTVVEATPPPDPIELEGRWRFEREGPNALVIASWRAMEEPPEGADPSVIAAPDADDGNWMPMRPGAWAFQLPAEPDREAPFPVWFRIPFDVDDVPSRLEVVIDGFAGSDHRLFVNGRPVEATPVRASFDAQMRSVEVTPLVAPGRNVLAVRLVIDEPTGGLLDAVKLMGEFSLDGDRIVAPREQLDPAPWTEHGAPFFSGTGTYRARVDVPSTFSGRRVFIEVPMVDDVLEVHVDGRSAGVRLWDPYVVEVTELATPGEHEVAISVTNTLANLLNGVPRHSGISGPPRLVAETPFEFDLTETVAEIGADDG
ncbi:MAG TPA: glycosyl hydrolase [Actinomycetota bacterium]|nr:glycosyl hydrolase [Actinomycetota bacterium]